MDYDLDIRSRTLYKAALEDDWKPANRIFQDDEEKLTAKLTNKGKTPLHIAVGTNRSNRFVKELVERIMATGGVEKLRTLDGQNNSLHIAAMVGNTTAARILVEKDPEMPQIVNADGKTTLLMAAWFVQKETLCYLLEVTKDVVGEDGISPFRGVAGYELINYAIIAGFYDVALYLVEKYPNLAVEEDGGKWSTLLMLAKKPNAFPSGSALGFWQLIIYSWILVNRETALKNPIKGLGNADYSTTNTQVVEKGATTNLLIRFFKIAHYSLNVGFWSVLRYLVPYIKNIHHMKVTHIQVEQLVKTICSIVIKKDNHSIVSDILGISMSMAVTHGIDEIIKECIRNYPTLFWYPMEGEPNLFYVAIKHRQEKVYNLVYQISGHKVFALSDYEDGENALHFAGKLAPQHRLSVVTGAALQMQRELQWFKEVEKFVLPSFKEYSNREGKTPRMVFTEEHKDLLKEGQQWMKDTSSSSTVVAALIVTIAFAAIFTVPGGNKDDGKPFFLQDAAFMLFAVSDAIALFSASTSVLMFLSVLTSRYAEEDFLYALPKRLTIGLLSLFISLAATMVAFSATLVLVLRDKVEWIIVPVALVACIPVSLFIMLQFPLLVELVRSTYGKGIFYKQNDELLH